MFTTTLAIAPVFLLILMGYGLRRGGIPSTEFWNLNDKLVYWVLMPALFYATISTADLSAASLGGFGAMLYAGFFAATAFGFAAQYFCKMAPPQGSDVVQGSGRFNTFVGLAIAEALYGAQGLQTAVLGSALLVPVVNVAVVTILTVMFARGGGALVARVLRELVRNPLILSIAAGLAANLAGLGGLPVLHETASILGQGALPVMLLCVGANLKLDGMRAALLPVALASVGKLVVFPLVVVAVALALGLSGTVVDVAVIYAALPTAVAAYTLARQFGGDTGLMATIITVQTLLAFVTIPLTLALVAQFY